MFSLVRKMTAGSARVLAGLGALAVVVCVPADAAEQQPNVGLAATCHGINMLDEIRATTPDVYAEIEATASKTANARAVLWKVEKADVAPSYLLGTIHMTDPRVTVLSPQIQDALLHSDTVALEVADVSADATNAAMLKAASLVLFTDGRKLDGLLSSDEYKKVQETLSDAGLPGELAAMFRPWVVSMILSVSSCERQKVKAGQPVLDMKIATAARARGLKVVGLETIESQLAAMANIPDDQQVAMLRAGLKYVNRANDTMETLLQLYLRRNMGAAWPFHLVLARQAGVGQQSFSGFQKKIVDDRNRAMLVSAMPILKKGRSLIAVGVLHLVGEEGLVEGLRKEGFTVTAIE